MTQTISGFVDGADATVILSGTTGGVQEPLIEHILTPEEAMREIAMAQGAVDDAEFELKPYADALKDAKKKLESLVERVAGDYRKRAQPPLFDGEEE